MPRLAKKPLRFKFAVSAELEEAKKRPTAKGGPELPMKPASS